MLFLQATMSPVVVILGDKILHVPKMQIDHHIVKGAEISAARTAEATKGLDEIRRREYLTFYPPVQPDIVEMRRFVATPEGIRWVIETMLPYAKVYKRKEDDTAGSELPSITSEEVIRLFTTCGTGRFYGIAREIADLTDTSMIDPFPKPAMSQNGSDDPLKQSESGNSTDSHETGARTLPHSKSPMVPEPGVVGR